MSLAKTFTAMALAASLAMFPACSDTKYRNLGGETAPAAGGTPSFLAHMKGAKLETGSNPVQIYGPTIIYNPGASEVVFNVEDGIEDANKIVISALGSEATAEIGTSLTNLATDIPALKGLSTVFGADTVLAEINAFDGKGATNEEALADFASKVKAELEGAIADASAQLTAAIALLASANLEAATVADFDNSGGGGTNFTAAQTFKATALGAWVMTEDGIFDGEDEIIGSELLEAMGFEWAASSGSGEWLIETSILDAALANDGLKDDLIGELGDLAAVDADAIDAMLEGALAANSTKAGKELTLGKQALQYSTYGYYKEVDSSRATGDDKDTVAATATVDAFYGHNGKADFDYANGNAIASALDGLDIEDAAAETTFQGKTVASLTVEGKHTDLTGDATLTFGKTGTTASEKLYLGFTGWYDVEFTDRSTAKIIYDAAVGFDDFTLSKDGVETGDVPVDTATFEAAYAGKGELADYEYIEATGKFSATDSSTFDQAYDLKGAFGVVGQ